MDDFQRTLVGIPHFVRNDKALLQEVWIYLPAAAHKAFWLGSRFAAKLIESLHYRFMQEVY
jgi:hypothetical protein